MLNDSRVVQPAEAESTCLCCLIVPAGGGVEHLPMSPAEYKRNVEEAEFEMDEWNVEKGGKSSQVKWGEEGGKMCNEQTTLCEYARLGGYVQL
jgi:hypothetical protein